MKTVGDGHWASGPIILGSKKLHAGFVKSFTKADAKPINRLKKIGVAEIAGESVVVIPGTEETGYVAWDKAAVLVRALETAGHLLENDRAAAMASIDPRTIPAADWKPGGTITLAKDPVLFDVQGKHLEGTNRKQTLPVKLAAGEYVVEVATGTIDAKPYPTKIVAMKYWLVRLRPPDWVQPAVKASTPVVDEGPVVASAEVIAGAKKLQSASGDGIPMMVVPKKHMAAWKGIGTGEEDCDDYDRACDVDGVEAIKVGKGKGLVISEPAGIMFWPTKTGGLIVMWLGAESRAGCIAAALSIPDKAYKKEKAKLVVEKGAEELVIFDSASPGDSMTKAGKIGPEGESTATFKLAAGTYAIESEWSWEARVKVGKKIEDTMIGVLRLTHS